MKSNNIIQKAKYEKIQLEERANIKQLNRQKEIEVRNYIFNDRYGDFFTYARRIAS